MNLLTNKITPMSKINKFLFYTGLFTINAFQYNWKAIIYPTVICGTAMALLCWNAWLFIPSFIGSYLACVHDEYVNYKKATNDTTTGND